MYSLKLVLFIVVTLIDFPVLLTDVSYAKYSK